MYHGYPFLALFLAISVDLWLGGNAALLLGIENISLGKIYVFRLLRFKFQIQFNHKGFLICSNDLATYVSSGTDEKSNFVHSLQGMYDGYPFFALFFAILVDLWWGSNV